MRALTDVEKSKLFLLNPFKQNFPGVEVGYENRTYIIYRPEYAKFDSSNMLMNPNDNGAIIYFTKSLSECLGFFAGAIKVKYKMI